MGLQKCNLHISQDLDVIILKMALNIDDIMNHPYFANNTVYHDIKWDELLHRYKDVVNNNMKDIPCDDSLGVLDIINSYDVESDVIESNSIKVECDDTDLIDEIIAEFNKTYPEYHADFDADACTIRVQEND